MMALLQRLVTAVTTGYILMFYSELFFFNEEPALQAVEFASTNAAGGAEWLVVMTFFYSTFAYVLLTALGLFRVNNIWSLVLAGCLFGWCVEGLLVTLVYTDMPGSIAWPSIGWHAIVDVAIGWYLVRRILARNQWPLTVLTAALLGAFWGVWATWFWIDPAGYEARVSSGAFADFAAIFGGFCVMAYAVQERFGGPVFQPSKVEVGLAVAWCLLLYLTLIIPSVGILAVVLPPLFAVVIGALWKSAPPGRDAEVLTKLSGPAGWPNYVAMLLMPVVASATYALMCAYDVRIPIVHVVVLPLTYAGSAAVLFGVAKAYASKPRERLRAL